MEEKNIDELISKFLAGEAGPDEAMELEDWKETSAENNTYYLQCEQLFYAGLPIKKINEKEVIAALESVKEKLNINVKQTRIIPLRRYISIAASLVLIVGAAVVLYTISRGGSNAGDNYITYTSEEKVVLEDNSSVKLSPNSSFMVDKGFGKTNRLVKLKGSAYFEVTHTEILPLVVDAGHLFIKDIGTKFKITTSYTGDTVNIKVDEGIVQLYDSLQVSLTLNAGEEATYIKSLKKIAMPAQVTNFNFKNQSLKNIITQLSKAYNTPIILENKGIENCHITAGFAGEELETVLDIITETLGLTYTKTNNEYTIKGNSCNK